MRSAIPYSLALVGIILTASLAVLGQGVEDPCLNILTCQECVVFKTNTSSNGTCVFMETGSGHRCTSNVTFAEDLSYMAADIKGCKNIPTPPPPAPSNATTTSTTAAPTTTNATTVAPTTPTTTAPSTNGTTPTPAPTPTTSGTTTTAAPTPSTNVTTTAAPPSNATTTAAPTPIPPTPRKGGFAWGEFIGGIVFAVALSSLAYLIWRFYKARLDRNYHTFSNPTF